MNKYVAFVFCAFVCLFAALFANIACAEEANLNAETAFNRVFEDGIANALNDVIHNSIDSIDDEVNNLRLLNVPHSELISKIIVLRKHLISEQYEEAEKALGEAIVINETINKIREAKKTFHEKAKAAFVVKSLNSREIALELVDWKENEVKAEIDNWNWNEKKDDLEIKINDLCEKAENAVALKDYESTQKEYKEALANYKKRESLYRKILEKCNEKFEKAKANYNSDVKGVMEAELKKIMDESQNELSDVQKELDLAKNEFDKIKREYDEANDNIKALNDDFLNKIDKVASLEAKSYSKHDIEYINAVKDRDVAENRLNESKKDYKKSKIEKNYNEAEKNYKNAQKKFDYAKKEIDIVKDLFNNYLDIDYISHDKYAAIKDNASKIAKIFSKIDKEVNVCENNLKSDDTKKDDVIKVLNSSRRLRTFPLRIEVILCSIEAKDKEADQAKEVLDNLFANINTSFAIAYFNKGVTGKKRNEDLDKSIDYAKKMQNKNLSQCIQGLCFYFKTISEPNDALSNTFKSNAVLFLKDVGSDSFNSGNIRGLQRLFDELTSTAPFIEEAEKTTLNGNANAAIEWLEIGLKIHRNNPELARFLLDSYRRSSCDYNKLEVVYNRCKNALDNNDNDALISKAMFLSHLFDKVLATDVKNYDEVVSKYNNDCSDVLTKIGDNKSDNLTMASFALKYSMSFNRENFGNNKLKELSDFSHTMIKKYHDKSVANDKRIAKVDNMDDLLFYELLLKTYLARGRSTLENLLREQKQNEEQQLKQNSENMQNSENILGVKAYSIANNLSSKLPYNNTDIYMGDALLMGVNKYSTIDIESPFKLQTENDLIGKLKSVYELTVMNFSDIDDIVPQLNNNRREQSYGIYKPYHSFAERDFDIICERLKNQVDNEIILKRLLLPFQALALVRGNNPHDAIKYLFDKYGVHNITDFEKKIYELYMNSKNGNSEALSDLEKALLFYALAESLHGLNMSYGITVEPQINGQPISRTQLRDTILEFYNKVATLSKENSLNYLNIMAERGTDFYKDESFITGIIEGYRSSFDTQPQRTIKIVKEALRIHPESHKLWKLWIESEVNQFRRNDLSNKSDYCNTLLNELDLFNKVGTSENNELKFGTEFGVEMLRGIVYKEQGKFKEASACFEKAAAVSNATPQEKAWALSMSVLVQTALLDDSSDND